MGGQEPKKSARRGPDPEWFKTPRSCRPGGNTGVYICRYECMFKQCCARFNMEMTHGAPAPGDVISVRSFIQANDITVSSPTKTRKKRDQGSARRGG